jgi:hypothetical protein
LPNVLAYHHQSLACMVACDDPIALAETGDAATAVAVWALSPIPTASASTAITRRRITFVPFFLERFD